ncbi:leucine-rich repeat receptor protein kinase MSP1-like [Gossypium australe]|uniref:Leucine-rich repeat receptor protein kinase MSP1-like n=1 Tax=Gossypium australe TaxID=47621 RepID=A0A5B6V3W1_9ROSI|nr:leucine-rich repeat receptor protein kinase MSP1-like [Gossypium australe]
MRTSALVLWLFFYSYVATIFRIKVCSVSGQSQSDQQELLLRLKNSLNSSSSEKLVKCNQSTDCYSWDGITCNADGQVIGLDLSKQLTSGAIDKANSFTGQIPVGISYMTKLVTLDLSKSWLLDLGSLKLKKPNLVMLVQNLTRLQNLYLDGIDISVDRYKWSQALSSSLPDLQVLSMSSCHLLGPINHSLAKLKSLSIIRLARNNLVGPLPKYFAEFQNLTSLYLVPSFTMLKALAYLNLAGNQLNGSVLSTNWSSLLNLVSLNLARNSFSGTVPPTLFQSQSLRRIYLPQNQFTGGFSKVKGEFSSLLGAIDLSHNSSVLPHEIGDFLQVAFFFSLSGNKFHESIPKSICQGSSLLVLDLSNNSLSGSVPECLIQMSVSLGVLNLKRNNLSSNILDILPENCVLHTLDLSRNRLGEKVPKSLVKCRMLEVLDLGNNQIDDTFPCHLKSTSRLRVLVLRSNKFKGDINCRENITWPMLQIIDLASNSFGGKLPQ